MRGWFRDGPIWIVSFEMILYYTLKGLPPPVFGLYWPSV
jgi:hypothetical protein